MAFKFFPHFFLAEIPELGVSFKTIEFYAHLRRPMKFTVPFTMIVFLSFAASGQVTPFDVNAGDDGFTGWTDNSTGSNGGRFLGSNTTIDTTGTNGTVSWGFFGNAADTSTGSSYYDFGGALQAGDTVSINISLGFINAGGVVGIGLQNSSGINRFETYYRGSDPTDGFKLNDAEGEENITGATTTYGSSNWVNDGNFQTIVFTQLGSNQYSLTFNGDSVTNSNLNLNASDISRIRIFNFAAAPNSSSGSNYDQYFNSLAVIPEPSSLMMLGLAGAAAGGLLLLKRKRS